MMTLADSLVSSRTTHWEWQHRSCSMENVILSIWYCNVVYCCIFLRHVFWRSTKSAPFWLHTRMLPFSSGCLLILFDQNQHESTAICGKFLQNDFPDYSKHYDISRLSFDPGIAAFLRRSLRASWECQRTPAMRACEPIACPCKVRSDSAPKSQSRAEKKIEESVRINRLSQDQHQKSSLCLGYHLI